MQFAINRVPNSFSLLSGQDRGAMAESRGPNPTCGKVRVDGTTNCTSCAGCAETKLFEDSEANSEALGAMGATSEALFASRTLSW
uniref:Uncharacterized protein n=1 Tax=Romanomermis culicivorax TaxID=13658 RepID=A0A915LB66_ROMCU